MINSDQTFHRSHTDDGSLEGAQLVRSSVRPLGGLSDFVVSHLPSYLHSINVDTPGAESRLSIAVETLANRMEIGKLVDEIEKEPVVVQSTALLDLAMIEAALRTKRLSVPSGILRGLDVLGARLDTFPGLSYELIIRSNPVQDLRTFTGSAAERFFYTYHEKIEDELVAVLSLLHGDGIEEASEYSLHSATLHLREVTRLMSLFKESVPRDEFNKFRPYVDGTRDGMKGPSGFRSSNLFAVAFAILGDELMPRRLKVEKDRVYYPTGDRPQLNKSLLLLHEGKDLFSRCRKDRFPPSLSLLVELAAAEYLNFLKTHLDIVRGVLAPEASGTAGTEGIPFLERGIERVEEAVRKFGDERKAANSTGVSK